jgi:hypothetical protein
MRAKSLCAVIFTVAAVIGGGAAEASPQPSGSSLVITAYGGDDGAVLAEVTLECAPTGGTHTDAENACVTLTAVDGELTDLPVLEVACVLIYQPVIVKVDGNWEDREVCFYRDYPNTCVAWAESGGVFRFAA